MKPLRLVSSVIDGDTASSGSDTGVAGFAKWDLEQDYEQRPRKKRKQDKEDTRLPIKTAEGRIERSRLPDVLSEDEVRELSGHEEVKDEPVEEKLPAVSPKQQVIDAKEELARIASLLNEDPEEHASLFRRLSEMGASAHATVKKLVLAAQLAVYRDVIPGYRIRPIEDAPDTVKVSKEVRRLRSFEQSLVSGYQSYVRELSRLARTAKDGMSAVAVSCACALLSSVPHFNFRGDLLQILVTKLSAPGKVDADFVKCRQTIETLFGEDEAGTPSLDATSLLTKMMKARGYRVDESVLNTFLHLRLLSDFSCKGSQNRIDPCKDAELSRGGKKIQQQRTFRTKKQRKQAKETKAVAKEMHAADASVSHEERDRMQAETLKLVFVTYFRILKLGVPSLMGAVLEGLAKYAHLINQDFFADLLEALKDLIRQSGRSDEAADDDDDPTEDTPPRGPSRESLLCIITAFALLQGQSISLSTHTATTTALNLDLHFFITHLYTTLHPLSVSPDLELSARSLRLPDPSHPRDAQPTKRVNHTTTIVLLLRCLSHTLVPPPPTPARSVSPTRLAAFVKQLMTISLQLPEKSALAVLHLLHRALKLQGRRLAGLWRTEERRGEGVWNGEVAGGWEGKNPFCATVWEGELLRLHYCQGVREGVKLLERVVAEVK